MPIRPGIPGTVPDPNGRMPGRHTLHRVLSERGAINTCLRSRAMLHLDLHFEDGTVQSACFSLPLEIGRGQDCHLRLKAWRVAKRHARIERRPAGLFLDDFGALSGTLVNGERIAQYGQLLVGDELLIGPCLIQLRKIDDEAISDERGASATAAEGATIAASPEVCRGLPKASIPMSDD